MWRVGHVDTCFHMSPPCQTQHPSLECQCFLGCVYPCSLKFHRVVGRNMNDHQVEERMKFVGCVVFELIDMEDVIIISRYPK
ncbi:hypothetical protein CsSME_00023697 [Camellia sinensis var. sinensis]